MIVCPAVATSFVQYMGFVKLGWYGANGTIDYSDYRLRNTRTRAPRASRSDQH